MEPATKSGGVGHIVNNPYPTYKHMIIILLIIVVAVFVPEALSSVQELFMVSIGKMIQVIEHIQIP